MKKGFVLALSLAMMSGLALSTPSKFSLKIGGGLGYTIIGELNTVLTDYAAYHHVISLNVKDDLGPLHFGSSFALEAVYSLNPSLSVGLAVGYDSVQNRGSIHRERTYPDYTVRVDETWTPKVRFIPVTISGYYILSLNPNWSVVLGAGLGYNWVTFIFEENGLDDGPIYGGTWEGVFRSSRGALGAQASLAVEKNISPLLSVFASACFRLASVSGFIGKDEMHWNNESGPGSSTMEDQTFWIYTYNSQGVGYTNHSFNSVEPPSSYYSDIHKGKINMGGAILGIGVRIKL